MMRKIIVSVAPVANGHPRGVMNPVAPADIAREVIACEKAGACVVHLHVRDGNGNPTKDCTEFSRTLELIRNESNIIIQGSTGGISELSLDERCVALNDPRVEMATLNMGSVNLGENVYINRMSDIRYWTERMKQRDVIPELEIFEAGMINNVTTLSREGVLGFPFIFAFCLGFSGALPANPGSLYFLKSLLPPGSIWGIVHDGMEDLSLLATAIGLGANFVRVGFEDSIYYSPGKTSSRNSELVERVTSMIKCMGLQVCNNKEAREVLMIRRGLGQEKM